MFPCLQRYYVRVVLDSSGMEAPKMKISFPFLSFPFLSFIFLSFLCGFSNVTEGWLDAVKHWTQTLQCGSVTNWFWSLNTFSGFGAVQQQDNIL